MNDEPASQESIEDYWSTELADADPGSVERKLLPIADRYPLVWRVIGIHVVYRNTGGSIIVSGLAYMALFALIPVFALLAMGIYALIEDPVERSHVLGWIVNALPVFEDLASSAIERADRTVAIGGLVALAGFLWGASGFYLNLTRATERFFPGKRKSGMRARGVGILLVILIIIAVIAALAGIWMVNAVATELGVDADLVLGAAGIVATVLVVTGLVYGVYRIMPANPPSAYSARLPAVLAGLFIAGLTLFYSLVSPWLVRSFETFGVMASVFVALVWLRLVFMAVIYGAAMARYRDQVALAILLGHTDAHRAATQRLRSEEMARFRAELDASKRVADMDRAAADARSDERMRQHQEKKGHSRKDGDTS